MSLKPKQDTCVASKLSSYLKHIVQSLDLISSFVYVWFQLESCLSWIAAWERISLWKDVNEQIASGHRKFWVIPSPEEGRDWEAMMLKDLHPQASPQGNVQSPHDFWKLPDHRTHVWHWSMHWPFPLSLTRCLANQGLQQNKLALSNRPCLICIITSIHLISNFVLVFCIHFHKRISQTVRTSGPAKLAPDLCRQVTKIHQPSELPCPQSNPNPNQINNNPKRASGNQGNQITLDQSEGAFLDYASTALGNDLPQLIQLTGRFGLAF